MKQFFTCLLALIMALPMTACAAEAADFTDVPADADYAQAVAWCREQGLMNGTSDTQFSPDDTLTRAMVVTVLYRRAGQPGLDGENLGYPFADVDASAWYGTAVYWARLRGIVQGYGDGRFGTEDPITREQLDIILRRYQGEDPVWTGEAALAVPATRAQAALAFYGAFRGESSGPDAQPSNTPAPTPAPENGRVLVAYFSATGNTETVANHIKDILGDAADLHEILPETPYTSADLNYNTDCRANREQNDDSARPAISGGVENMEQYNIVFLGYPIWWGRSPKIIHTFLEGYDFTGKTIVPFCTSGSSPYNDSTIRPLAPDADWRTGQRFGAGAARSAVESWMDSLDLPMTTEGNAQMYLQVGDTVWTATLEDNPSVAAWRELLAQGPLTVEMHDYGGFEKVGGIGATLTRSDRQITTEPGDIILYQGNSVTIYYGENSWNFTPLGHVSGVAEAELRQVLKAGGENVSVTFSLKDPMAGGNA